MYKTFKEKINNLLERVILFTRNNLAQLSIIGGTFFFLEIIRTLPYVNIIPSYQFLVIGFILFLTGILFWKVISDNLIITIVTALFIMAAILTIFEVLELANLIGFTIFILLLFLSLRGLIINRKFFKGWINE